MKYVSVVVQGNILLHITCTEKIINLFAYLLLLKHISAVCADIFASGFSLARSKKIKMPFQTMS